MTVFHIMTDADSLHFRHTGLSFAVEKIIDPLLSKRSALGIKFLSLKLLFRRYILKIRGILTVQG
jgi:hypothetical protein